MNASPSRLSPLVRHVKALGPSLLSDAMDPHAELLTLFWGLRFDREHALALWARHSQRQPVEAAPLLPTLLSIGDRFDALERAEKDQLRRLIARHRCQQPGSAV